MTDRSAFDILFDRLSERGMQPEKHISERNFIVPGKDRLSNTKYITAKKNSLFFCAYDSYGTSAYSSRTFTGIYSPLDLPSETDCHVYRKDWIDRFFRRNKRKSGIRFIDEKLTITSSNSWTPATLLTPHGVALFLEINKSIAPLEILIRYDHLSFIESLKGKTVLGLETNSWIYDNNDLDSLVNSGGQLIESMANACSSLRK